MALESLALPPALPLLRLLYRIPRHEDADRPEGLSLRYHLSQVSSATVQGAGLVSPQQVDRVSAPEAGLCTGHPMDFVRRNGGTAPAAAASSSTAAEREATRTRHLRAAVDMGAGVAVHVDFEAAGRLLASPCAALRF